MRQRHAATSNAASSSIAHLHVACAPTGQGDEAAAQAGATLDSKPEHRDLVTTKFADIVADEMLRRRIRVDQAAQGLSAAESWPVPGVETPERE